MKFSFHPLAVKELIDSINYYENISPGLGLEFFKKFPPQFKELSNFPMHGLNYRKIVEDALPNAFLMELFIMLKKARY